MIGPRPQCDDKSGDPTGVPPCFDDKHARMNRKEMAHPKGFEPLTSAFGGQRSIQLSYGCREHADISRFEAYIAEAGGCFNDQNGGRERLRQSGGSKCRMAP